MKRRVLISTTTVIAITVVGSAVMFMKPATAQGSTQEPGYVPSAQLEFAGDLCVPDQGAAQLNTTYTYPDGVHPVVSFTPDPTVVATFKSEQAQIASVATEMENEQNVIAQNDMQNKDPDQSILNSYVTQYDNLLAQYDTCTPNN
jgi:hypothetical protein